MYKLYSGCRVKRRSQDCTSSLCVALLCYYCSMSELRKKETNERARDAECFYSDL